MTDRIAKLAPGAYDVLRGEEVAANLVRNGERSSRWSAEFLAELPRAHRPAPFVDLKHHFSSLEEACAWLGADVEGVGARVPGAG